MPQANKFGILGVLLCIAGTCPAVAGPLYVAVVSPCLELGYLDTSNPSYMTIVGSLSSQLTGLDFNGSGNLYGSDANGNLYAVNPTTAALTLIGSGVSGVEGLAWDPVLWSMLADVNTRGSESIYTVSLSNGTMTLLTTVDGIRGDPSIAVSPSGGIYLLGQNPDEALYIDPNTLLATPFNTTGLPAGQAEGASFLGSQFFWSIESGTQSSLYSVDPSNGSATLMGSITVNGNGAFLGPYGISFTQNFVTTDLAGSVSASSVPEPPAVLLCGVGLLAVAICARYRRRRGQPASY